MLRTKRFNIMKVQVLSASALLLAMASGATFAKVSNHEAAKLGGELTRVGAQASGNKDGSIPGYTGGLKQNTSADQFADVFAHEKPLFTITAKNLGQYKDKLTDGQVALFEKYPETYVMPIYKTHRSAAYSNRVLAKAKKNAVSSELVSGGNGLKNFDETIPFAIPQNGLEVIWNHISRYRGGSVERTMSQFSVNANGGYVPVVMKSTSTIPHELVDGYDAKKDDNILFYYMQAIESPARLTGNVLLVHETIDQVSQPRKAWSYNAGQRRVRRAPQIAYDAPAQASDGLRTADQIDMYNGAPNKYNWKLLGKKEIYIPYNAYKLADNQVKYRDILKTGHIDQSYTRYELHRVWQVEATLKEGERHVYGKRTFYVDEDSWQIAVADLYDNRGVLWRASEGHALQFVNVNANWYVANTSYDLLSGSYAAELQNEEQTPFVFGKKMKHKNFTAAALRRAGKR